LGLINRAITGCFVGDYNMPRGVPNARSVKEIQLLISLVTQHIEDVQLPGRSGISRQKKIDAWTSIEKDFNGSKDRSRRVSSTFVTLLCTFSVIARCAWCHITRAHVALAKLAVIVNHLIVNASLRNAYETCLFRCRFS